MFSQCCSCPFYPSNACTNSFDKCNFTQLLQIQEWRKRKAIKDKKWSTKQEKREYKRGEAHRKEKQDRKQKKDSTFSACLPAILSAFMTGVSRGSSPKLLCKCYVAHTSTTLCSQNEGILSSSLGNSTCSTS